MVIIKNKNIEIKINELGAELASFKINNINILWQKNDLWNYQAPLLFPNIGSFKENRYYYDGREYKSLVHGFLKDCLFEIVELKENYVILQFINNEDTLKYYPFSFEFVIKYELLAEKLNVDFEIKNQNEKPIYFAFGFHPGYDYKGIKELLGENIEFNLTKDYCDEVIFSPDYVKEIVKTKLENMSLVDLSKKLVVPRTIAYKLEEITLKSTRARLIFKHNMQYIAYWQKLPESKPEFICIEAWDGTPDYLDSNRDLKMKKCLLKLDANEVYKRYYTIEYKMIGE